ncbi:MAG: DUF1566 domain-containing protein [Candidatus Electrothrix sp. AR1]|nr:DUF1566 domain-containing protein [Candidatus Electrothrix sp. AR1]
MYDLIFLLGAEKMRKIILLAGLVAGGVALSVTASANNWLLYLPAILGGSSGGTEPTSESTKWLLFLPAVLSGSQGGTTTVTVTGVLNDTGITTPVGSTGKDDANYGRDLTNNDSSDGHAGFSFTSRSSTCVLDNVTGLAWEVKTDDGGSGDRNNTYDWAGATAYAESFTGCGTSYPSCRLPTVKELLGIVSFGSAPDYIDKTFFPNNVTSAYWSSTPFANDQNVAPVKAWDVNFTVPYVDNNAVEDSFYVRAVCE